MKKITLICFIAIAILLGGCKKFLEEKPYSQLTPDNAYLTEEGAQKAVNGAYAMLQNGIDFKFSACLGELGTDEATSGNDIFTDHELQLDSYTYSSEYDVFKAVYQDLFEGVKRCNVVIDLLPDALANKEIHVAQAKFLRGVYYFHLVKLFGGVPLWVTGNADKDNLRLPRATVDEVYTQIIADLKAAEEGLPEVAVWPNAVDKGRATKYAAQAILARVYLQKRDYPNALDYCNRVINPGIFHLYDNYADIYDPAHKNEGIENIFEIQHRISGKSEDDGSTISDWYLPTELQGTQYTGWAMMHPTDYIYNSYKADDNRKAVTYFTSGVTSAGQTVTFTPHVFKYHNRTAGIPVNDGDINFPLIRFADVLLMKAEALNELNASPDQKFDCINLVRDRAGLDPVSNTGSNSSQEGFLATLLTERMHELCFENVRRWDLIRTGKLQSYVADRKPERPVPGKGALYYPLPLLALDANPLLTQLEGY